MATPEGQALLQQMAAQSDILVENFKTGGLAQYGLDHESLRAAQPAPHLLQRDRLRPRRAACRARRLRPDDPGHQRHDEHHRPARRRARRRPAARGRGADRPVHRRLREHRDPGRARGARTAPARASTSTWRCSTSAWRSWPTRPAPFSTPATCRSARATAIRAWRRTRTSTRRTARCCWRSATTASSRASARRPASPSGPPTRASRPTRCA